RRGPNVRQAPHIELEADLDDADIHNSNTGEIHAAGDRLDVEISRRASRPRRGLLQPGSSANPPSAPISWYASIKAARRNGCCLERAPGDVEEHRRQAEVGSPGWPQFADALTCHSCGG